MERRSLTIQDHRRELEQNRYVYAVLSRRSGGVSIGINLNPDTVCNFDCIYCQVDRKTPPRVREVDLAVLEAELDDLLAEVASGTLFQRAPFAGVPTALRRVVDIAFSGDGEPTTFPRLKEAVELAIAAKERAGLSQLKLVLITNATQFHRPRVREALRLLDAHQGEIWAKLDAGTEAYYRQVDVTTIPFSRVLANILAAARIRPMVIQSLFMRIDGCGPGPEEIQAYAQRLREVVTAGGHIKQVQVYTIARPPAQANVTPLPDAAVDAITEVVRQIPLPATSFYGGARETPAGSEGAE